MKKKAPGDTLAEVLAFLGMPGRTIAAIIGPDGLPMAKKADLRFEEGGALYFDTVKSSRFYGGLSMHPFLRLYAENEAGDVLRLSGKAVFTEDPAVREKCFAACPALAERFCADARPFIAYFLTEVTAEIYPKDGEEPTEVFPLPEPAGVLIGIRLKKDTEIRDRIAKVLARREETDFPAEGDRGASPPSSMTVRCSSSRKLPKPSGPAWTSAPSSALPSSRPTMSGNASPPLPPPSSGTQRSTSPRT